MLVVNTDLGLEVSCLIPFSGNHAEVGSVQRREIRSRVVQDIRRIHSEREAAMLAEAERLRRIHVKAPLTEVPNCADA